MTKKQAVSLPIGIRPATIEDRPHVEIREIAGPEELRQGFEVLRELRAHLTLPEFHEICGAAMAKDDYRLIGAFENNECLAVMGYRILFDFVHGKHVYIDDLVVTAHRRSKGIGLELLRYAEKIAKDLRCKGLRLCTGVDRKDAQRFYERNGWKARAVAYKKLTG